MPRQRLHPRDRAGRVRPDRPLPKRPGPPSGLPPPPSSFPAAPTRLLPPENGRALAESPGARLQMLEGVGPERTDPETAGLVGVIAGLTVEEG